MGLKMMSMGRSWGLSCCLCRRNRALFSKSLLCDPYLFFNSTIYNAVADRGNYLVATIHFFFKSTIYYTGHNGSPCLQEELCMEYQYSNLFMQLPNTKDY